MKISVILPCYNVEKYIRRGLDSILRQSYQNWEAILVDDGAKDSTGAICDEYANKDPRFWVIHKVNEGVSVARNTGLEQAKGDIIYFMDPDDWIEDNCFKVCVKEFQTSNADIVHFNRNWWFGSNKHLERELTHREFSHHEIVQEYTAQLIGLGQNALNHWYQGEFIWKFKKNWQVWCFMFNRKLIIENNIIFQPDLRMFEDILFVVDCSIHTNKLVTIPDIMYNYDSRENGVMNTRVNNTEKIFADKYNLLEHRARLRKKVREMDLHEYYLASQVLSSLELVAKLSFQFSNYSLVNRYIKHPYVQESLSKVSLYGAPIKFKLPVLLLKCHLQLILFTVCWLIQKVGLGRKLSI